ncbi:MAG: sulfite exporter TauE/SafE family protein [Planctomycetes bacterium]|nr:sulfite exporter TauE/SafE family protein [Planctomycetota bacterium]
MTAWEAAVPSFLFGIASSAHCAGMCGVFALRAGGTGRFALYALGKAATYVVLGTIAGALGAGAVRALGGAQAWVGVAAGLLLVLAGVRLLRPGDPRSGPFAAFLAPLAGAVETARVSGGAFLFGAMTGLLPCGVVYLAAAQGAATASPVGGAISMAAFGMGTVPVLAAVALLGRGAMMRVGPSRVRTAGAVLVIVTGVVTGVRAAMPMFAYSGSACPVCREGSGR